MREKVTVILTDAAVKNKALEDDQQRSNSQKDRRIERQGESWRKPRSRRREWGGVRRPALVCLQTPELSRVR